MQQFARAPSTLWSRSTMLHICAGVRVLSPLGPPPQPQQEQWSAGQVHNRAYSTGREGDPTQLHDTHQSDGLVVLFLRPLGALLLIPFVPCMYQRRKESWELCTSTRALTLC